MASTEKLRLKESRENKARWKKWGPYLSERQWGTVREDYSDDGDAWNYFTHDQARSRAYRWGEDGLAGISDDKQQLCFALALWNGKDTIVKERLFGITNNQGNHGEDVKDYYFYLDSTPTHSYMKYLYKYPQTEFPYADLVSTNQARSQQEPEYELLDTGIFNEDRYFDIFVEYAKAEAEDILIQITICNRGPDVASLRVLPTLWFRNTWAWTEDAAARPMLAGADNVRAIHPELGEYRLYCQGTPNMLFTENETNNAKLFGTANSYPYVKDGINEYIINANENAVNPDKVGTKVAADYAVGVKPGATEIIHLRLTQKLFGPDASAFGEDFDALFETRRAEADAFYQELIPDSLGEDEGRVIRQALAGMMWTKQYYEYNVNTWLREHAQEGVSFRNSEWAHMDNHDIISMPDKWEYPWYATWDLAFHTIALVMIDEDFAKQQLMLFLEDRYMHADGQLPAYEWNFSDVNPPVHPFALYTIYTIDKEIRDGQGDIGFLKRGFDKLSLNFNWWINKKDPTGKNVFEGGFLGLDNIGVFDRSSTLPTGGHMEQSDGTAWMALYAQYMLRIAIELAQYEPSYEEKALSYFEHFIHIASAMDKIGENHDDMWDHEDGFFYDVLRFPDGSGTRLKVRSLVGLLPMCASSVINADELNKLPKFKQRYETIVSQKEKFTQNIACPETPGVRGRRLLAVLDEDKLHRVLIRMLDENEFLGPFGIRSLSRYHEAKPYSFHWNDEQYSVAYLPGESDSGMFGGNSNWRGPVWMPTNFLIIRSLINLYTYYGDDFKVEYPTGSGQEKTLFEVSTDIMQRLTAIFLRNQAGIRPVYGGSEKFQHDPHWRDHILFYEYFHADNGSGIGASHQTGWTGIIATILVLQSTLDSSNLIEKGIGAATDALADL